jgi:hypothetical protein
MKEVLPWLVYWVRCSGTSDICPDLVALVGTVQYMFYLTVHFSVYLSPSPSKLGRQSCWVACLLIWVSGYKRQKREGKTSEIKTRKKILELLDKDW